MLEWHLILLNVSMSTKTVWLMDFTKEHGVHCPVWYETHETPEAAILREKQIKKWERKWKLRLIEEKNPEWKDLYENLL
ncbi:hypothetical protein BMS3Abin08_00677 [bacterium BMS3Abin08]|nr:hypothetical protein BMS3Abin08_00677 [bacterium BMS3Abin08]